MLLFSVYRFMALFPARSKVVLHYFSLIFKGQPK
jgi:hypothetical protein